MLFVENPNNAKSLEYTKIKVLIVIINCNNLLLVVIFRTLESNILIIWLILKIMLKQLESVVMY